jgi:hypothetical protein
MKPQFDNLIELIRDIRKNVIQNGSTVLSADDPQGGYVGFSVFYHRGGQEYSRLYQIRLDTIHEDPLWLRFRSNFISSEKRIKFAAWIMSKECVICSEHDEYDSECDECKNSIIAEVIFS